MYYKFMQCLGTWTWTFEFHLLYKNSKCIHYAKISWDSIWLYIWKVKGWISNSQIFVGISNALLNLHLYMFYCSIYTIFRIQILCWWIWEIHFDCIYSFWDNLLPEAFFLTSLWLVCHVLTSTPSCCTLQVNQILSAIKRKKSMDTIILSLVASVCTFLIFIYWLSKWECMDACMLCWWPMIGETGSIRGVWC